MKHLILFLFVSLLTKVSLALPSEPVNRFKLNDNDIETLFQESEEISTSQVNVFESASTGAFVTKSGSDNLEMIGGIVAIASWITGIAMIIPIHRLVIGTGDKTLKILILYFCTSWSCLGIITLVDGIVLLADGSHKKYINNEKWIMWF